MLFIPKKTKYKKQQKGKSFNRIQNNVSINAFSNINFFNLNLISTTFGKLNSKQIIAIKQSINKIIKKKGKLKFNVFPQTPVTKKPIEVRMGKGKGPVNHWIFKINAGMIILDIEISNLLIGLKALKSAQYRFPFQTKILIN
jgi:large subunit ribosomal protein L16